MGPESSLQHSQVPATCLCPEPAQTIPYPHIPFLKMRLNVIIPSTPVYPQWSLSLRFSHQNPVHASALTHTRYMPRQSHHK
jgi:hypothetical protein